MLQIFRDIRNFNFHHPQIYLKSLPALNVKKLEFNHISPPVDFSYMTFRVTRGSKFTPFEKLIKPFDSSTWNYLMVTLTIGIIVVIMLKSLSAALKKLALRLSISDIIFDFSKIFFGIGLIQTPDRNSGRLLFTILTLTCLIIRTAYQGKMFDFLQYDEKQPDASTIQDLIDKQIPVKLGFSDFSDMLKTEHNLTITR